MNCRSLTTLAASSLLLASVGGVYLTFTAVTTAGKVTSAVFSFFACNAFFFTFLHGSSKTT